MTERVELRMKCPVCGVRNHSVTFLADGPTTYHDCGHTSADEVPKTIVGVLTPPEMTVEEAHDRFGKSGQAVLAPEGTIHPGSGLIDVRWRQEHEGSFPPPEACPECVQGKHGNCDGTAWDNEADASIPCDCATRSHR